MQILKWSGLELGTLQIQVLMSVTTKLIHSMSSTSINILWPMDVEIWETYRIVINILQTTHAMKTSRFLLKDH
jgi:hypothetical protein